MPLVIASSLELQLSRKYFATSMPLSLSTLRDKDFKIVSLDSNLGFLSAVHLM